jgi:hypothetical protein
MVSYLIKNVNWAFCVNNTQEVRIEKADSVFGFDFPRTW